MKNTLLGCIIILMALILSIQVSILKNRVRITKLETTLNNLTIKYKGETLLRGSKVLVDWK